LGAQFEFTLGKASWIMSDQSLHCGVFGIRNNHDITGSANQ
jgi:hypothetical protein